MKHLILFLVMVILMVGCVSNRVDRGTVRDTIFSVEPTRGGAYSIFLTHDESVVYCTPDPELGRDALNLLKEHDGEVIIEFKHKDFWKDTEGELMGVSECANYASFSMVVLTDIYSVPKR